MEGTKVAVIQQSDKDLVRRMNNTQRNVMERDFDFWPAWAKRDAQLVANYREHFSS